MSYNKKIEIEVINMRKISVLALLIAVPFVTCCNKGTTKHDKEYLELWCEKTTYYLNEEGHAIKEAESTRTFDDNNLLVSQKDVLYDIKSEDVEIDIETIISNYTYDDHNNIDTIISTLTDSSNETTSTITTYSYAYRDDGSIRDKFIYTTEYNPSINAVAVNDTYNYFMYDELGRVVIETYNTDSEYSYSFRYTYKEDFTNYVSVIMEHEGPDGYNIVTINNELNENGYITNSTIYDSDGAFSQTSYTIDEYNCPISYESYTTVMAEQASFYYTLGNTSYYKNNPKKVKQSDAITYDASYEEFSSIYSYIGEYDEYDRVIKTTEVNSKTGHQVVYKYDRVIEA